jgi:hypothetical protein
VRKLGLLLVLVNVIWMAACGGSGGSSNNSTVTSVAASCVPSIIYSGQNSECSAAVNGTGNFSTTVTWSTNAGSIGSAAVLTAPTVTAPQTVTVTATSTQTTSVAGTATVTVNPAPTGANVAPTIVDSGPGDIGEVNFGYVTVTICVPGTNTCQTIDHVQVDTGSEGFRVLSSVLTLSLPQESIGGNPLDECLVFLDSYVWGPVSSATITVSGETTTNPVPVQIMIPSSGSPAVPSSCSSQTSGPNGGDSVSAFGANGLLGVGPFQQDCGLGCTSLNSQIPDVYYACSGNNCSASYVPLTQQVPNPVTAFSVDNNGVEIGFPAVPSGGASNVNGWLVFGIGTESNNSLNLAANVYTIPDSGNDAGDFITTFNAQAYPQSFIDSGSNGLFFLASSVNGVPPTCTGQNSDWYCPSGPETLSATNQGQTSSGATGSSVPISFEIDNANTLFSSNSTAYSTLGGPNPGSFDWGLSFFYGRNVFTAIDNMNTPVGVGPFFAY